MIGRIKEMIFPLYRKNAPTGRLRPALRGNTHNIIVVKAPHAIFTEAIFILRDDYYLDPSASAAELLRQARAAAESCAASAAGRGRE